MGEMADGMIDGLFCQECGDFIDGDEPGFPRTCENCDDENGWPISIGPVRPTDGRKPMPDPDRIELSQFDDNEFCKMQFDANGDLIPTTHIACSKAKFEAMEAAREELGEVMAYARPIARLAGRLNGILSRLLDNQDQPDALRIAARQMESVRNDFGELAKHPLDDLRKAAAKDQQP